MTQPASQKKARACIKAWEARERASGGDRGQIVAGRTFEVTGIKGGAGLWAAGGVSMCLEISVMPTFGRMEGAPYHLIQPPNIEPRGLDIKRPPKGYGDRGRAGDSVRASF